ncbi:disintegrin and metalloproteinase domain-containing protein 22-like [Python bivittatus]|uniref:Disintegrin and metalloproteinase domain-containing protein 22-like n=1 Tax=Python bivittatus TaxID=176946 RepID=A0A9F5MV61_PYTBI|nr:disintegrin and metalloproteinase domain-containing protein 22-like [Python bivittatus]
MHVAAPLLSLALWTLGMLSEARSGSAGDTLLTEMERKAADRFRERQKSVPFRLLYSASEGNETPHDLLDTRIGRSSAGKQIGYAFLLCLHPSHCKCRVQN